MPQRLAAVTVQHPAQLGGMIKAVNAMLTRQIAVRDPVSHLRLQPPIWERRQDIQLSHLH